MLQGIVSTISDRCKRCYSCVRECPAKAIRVIDGQAQVLQERCISCGHCVKVCSQDAKQVRSDTALVKELLTSNNVSVAIIAPSFAAAFPDNYKKLPSAIRKIGFSYVMETAFGADLISSQYIKELEQTNGNTVISSACPAVVTYIQKYFKELVPELAKVVSPMIAMGKYIKKQIGEETKVVFIGPCIAKKKEIEDELAEKVIDVVLTFTELKEMLKDSNIDLNQLYENDFDPPRAFLGKTYPLAGGLLKASNIPSDILEKDIITVEGKKNVMDIIDEIADNRINAKFIDILFCEGCISGPAIDSDLNYYARREKVINYVKESTNAVDRQLWKSQLYNSRKLNLTRTFQPDNQRRPMPAEDKIREILAETKKYSSKDELNCGACGYHTCKEYAVAIAKDLAEKEMCLPFLIDQLAEAYNNLSNTEEQLKIAEKLASIGQLAAGVAHELNNPLGTIMLYASLVKEELHKKSESLQDNEDLTLILSEAKRCKDIVGNLLNFARKGKLNVTKFDLGSLISEVIKPFSLDPKFDSIKMSLTVPDKEFLLEGDREQLKQVFINIINNACDSMTDCARRELEINLAEDNETAFITFSDSGNGIKKENFNKIFTPFFTTKNIGRGTGLGLAISYGIVKMHNGQITFQSEEGNGTTFKIALPIVLSDAAKK